MFYETEKNNHGLPHNPFKSLIVPRPIGWISSQDTLGNINLAPYSYFNAVCDNPPMVMFSTTNSLSDGAVKDTLYNVETQGEFVVNMATYEHREAMNLSSASLSRNENEFLFAQVEMIPSTLIKPPRVKGSPIQLECIYYQSIQLPTDSPGNTNRAVIGKVIGVHIDDNVIVDGKIDVKKIKPITRLGYMEYAVIDNVFNMQRPK
ncbi:MAG: flavin reductase family protein [Gammaproteobacteria bacterium]|nr:MAG: flavin reductase family protein [Gammaproteobacteria bacterium]